MTEPADLDVEPQDPERVAIDAPVVRFAVLMPNGEAITRDLDVRATAMIGKLGAPPPWLVDAAKLWPSPSDPVTFVGEVAEGHAAEALAWLGIGDAVEPEPWDAP